MKRIDLNVDIGEGFLLDEALLQFATSANICCGEHAGSRELTTATVELCFRKGVRVGAHPGYPDRARMGRRSLIEAPDPAEWLESIEAQIRWFCGQFSASYVKPHGGLYNDTAILLDKVNVSSPILRSAVASLTAVLTEVGIPLMGLAGTAHASFPRVIREGFADRRYTLEGTLVPRSEPNSVLGDRDEIRKQVVLLTNQVDSICLHGDTKGAVEFAELVYGTLIDLGYEVGA